MNLGPVRRSSALLKLLAAHGPLDDNHVRTVRDLLGVTVSCQARESPIQAHVAPTLLVTAGWAGAISRLADGRQQIVSLLLPGDFIRPSFYLSNHLEVVAFTSFQSVEAESLAEFLDSVQTMPFKPLARAWSKLREAFEKRLVRHAIRLGRMTAYERTADLFMELLERHQAAGLASGLTISMPLTQDVLADHLGLSVVHMNRTMQQLRGDGLITDRAGNLTIVAPMRLAGASLRTDT